jgi:FecR protein
MVQACGPGNSSTETTLTMKKNDSLAALPRLVFLLPALAHRTLPLCALLLCALPLGVAHGAKLKEARVTQVVRDVKLLPGQAAPRPASISDQVREGTAVRTGLESRAELTFTDATLARLGANTIFSFDQGTRNLQLGGGAILLRVPKDAGGAQINTAAITAAITGTTMLIEFHPDAYCKYIMLEGVARIFRNNKVGESVLLHAGQMLIVNPNGKGLPEPVDVDLDRLMKTSLLITGFGPLPSLNLIAREIGLQQVKKNQGILFDTHIFVFKDTVFDYTDPFNNDAIRTRLDAETPTPTPFVPPSKFGSPTTIVSSTPYVINSGTVIQTDPTVTTNGVTDFGVIYRGPEIDGPFSAFALGSTSPFDIASGFDAQIDSSGAVFVFTALQLAGNPTISTTNGETNLALIGVNGITSGGPGGVLTFAGLDGLLLATVDGSITLGSEISFEGLNDLTFYARGAESNLTLACDISTLNQLNLYSQGAVNLSGAISTVDFLSFSGGDFNLTGGSLEAETISIVSAANVNLQLTAPLVLDANDLLIQGGDTLAISSSLEVNQTNNGQIDLFNVDLTAGAEVAGGGISVGNNLTVTSDNSAGGFLPGSAEISLSASGNVNVGNDLTLTILNNDGGHIGGDALISIVAGGDLTANTINLLINNRSGGTIDLGATVFVSLAGALTTTGDVSLVISNRDDGGGGGTGEQSNVNLSAERIDIGGTLTAAVSANAGTNLVFASGSLFTSTDLITGGGLNFSIQNGGLTPIGFLGGGTMGDAVLELVAGGAISTGDFLTVLISNVDGGEISNNADIFVLAGSIDAQGPASFEIINSTFVNNLHSLIGGDAGIALTAQSLFSSETLLGSISNEGGDIINGHALLDFTLTGASESIGDTTFEILNEDEDSGYGGGTIGGDATIAVNAGSLAAANLVAQINNAGGAIGGDSSINFVIGEFAIPGDATFEISNGLGAITGDANIDLSVGSLTAGSLLLQIATINGSIDGASNLICNVDGDLTITGEGAFTLTIDSSLGGQIGGGGNIILTTGGNLTAGSVDALVNARDGGSIASGASILFDIGGDITTGLLSLVVSDRFLTAIGGTIGSDVTVSLTAASVSADFVNLAISARSGGQISGDVFVNLDVTGDLAAQNGVFFEIDNNDLVGNGIGGTIDGDAIVNVSAASISSAASFISGEIFNYGGGQIGGDALINFFISGDVNAPSDFGSLQLVISGGSGSLIGGDATIDANIGGNLNTNGDLFVGILNTRASNGILVGGSIDGSATVTFQSGDIFADGVNANINNTDGAAIGGSALVDVTLGDVAVGSDATFTIDNQDNGGAFGGGSIGGDASVIVGASSLSAASLLGEINNQGGSIENDSILDFTAGTVTTTGDSTFQILNDNNDFGGGTIGGSARISVAGSLSASLVNVGISNNAGAIGGDASVDLLIGNLTTDFLDTFIANESGGTIGSNAVINFAVGDSSAPNGQSLGIFNREGVITLDATVGVSATNLTSVETDLEILNENNGFIGGAAIIDFTASAVVGSLLATIDNGNSKLFPDAGTIVSDATINLSLESFFADNFGFISPAIYNQVGGSIGGAATITVNATGDITTESGATFQIFNQGEGSDNGAGTIGADASISVSANSYTTIENEFTTAPFDMTILNIGGGFIGGNATLNASITGGLTTAGTGDVIFEILNHDSDFGGGSIGGDATITVNAGSLFAAGSLLAQITNSNGTIEGSSNLTFGIGEDLTTLTSITAEILNDFGSIGGDASISLNAGSISADSLLLQIDDFEGTIDGDATITLNPTEALNTSGDATVNIDLTPIGLKNEQPATVAAINLNGGSYNVGGTFLATITGGDGGIAVNAASIQADIVKIGALGTNGTLTIGGGSLSADTTLKLYAGGSNGTIDFVADVTLSSSLSDAAIIAANTVTIENGVVVTTSGGDGCPALVFTNVPNYMGGNDTTTGKFAGDGAVTSPFSQAPPFDDPGTPEAPATGSNSSRAPIPTTEPGSTGDRSPGTNAILPRKKQPVPIARVADTNELLALLDKIPSGPAGPGGSNATTGKTKRGAGSVSLGKGGSSIQNLERANMTLNRSGARRPAALP